MGKYLEDVSAEHGQKHKFRIISVASDLLNRSRLPHNNSLGAYPYKQTKPNNNVEKKSNSK